jgi:competence protein ComEC
MKLDPHSSSANYIPKNTPSTYIGKITEISKSKSNYLKCIVNTQQTNTNKSIFKSLIFIETPSNIHLKINDKIIFSTQIQTIKNNGYPGEFDAERYWKNQGITLIGFVSSTNITLIESTKKSTQTLRQKLAQVLDDVLTGQEFALANAFILGDRELLNNETTQAFSNTGTMHILAVSGLHIGILLLLLTRIFSFFSRALKQHQAIIVALLIGWIYAYITGFSPSVLRSVIMFTFIYLGKINNKNNSELNLLALSAILILCWRPTFIYDIGFQLSYTAMLGIYLFYPYLRKTIVSKHKIIQITIEGSMIGIAAQITTLPFTLYYFHQFPNYFLLTNIALMAFSFVILLIGILLFSLYWITPLKIILGFILQKTMSLMLLIVNFFSKLSFSTANGFTLNKIEVLSLLILCFLLFISLKKRKLSLLYFTLTISLIICVKLFNQRFENNSSVRYFTFNSYTPIFILKTSHKNILFCKSKYKNTKKTTRMLSDFSSVYPGIKQQIAIDKLARIQILSIRINISELLEKSKNQEPKNFNQQLK